MQYENDQLPPKAMEAMRAEVTEKLKKDLKRRLGDHFKAAPQEQVGHSGVPHHATRRVCLHLTWLYVACDVRFSSVCDM